MSQRARAAQEWHKPAVIDNPICVLLLLRPVVTHQSAGQAWGKYEATGRLSGRAAAAGITLVHTQTAPSMPETWIARSHSAPLSHRISRRGWQMQVSGGWVRGWQQRVINMMDCYYGGSWLLFNTAWEGFEDANQSIWLVKHSPAGTSKAERRTPVLLCCFCRAART